MKGKKDTRNKTLAPARLSGFIKEEGIGLGDIIKGVAYQMGIEPCAGREKRAAALNRWMRFRR